MSFHGLRGRALRESMERMRAKANWVELGYVASMKKGNKLTETV